jgi:hypothetical protein
MSNISNRFFVTAIEDGTTLHGSLNTTKTLTQSYIGSNAVPNWTNADEQPIIYLNLYNGSKKVTNLGEGDIKWYYNTTEMQFTENGVSHGGNFKTDKYGGLPALKIIKNFATSDNVVDTITITCSGTYNGIEFSASIQIRVTVVSPRGYFGVLEFEDGKSVFTDDGDKITIKAHLYETGTPDEQAKKDYAVKWYLNDVETTGQGTGETDTHYYLKISDAQVTDNAIVRASFLVNNTVVYNTYVSIDDQTDPEYMYIQYNGANGQSATLRKDQEVTFDIWVGKTDDPKPVFRNMLYEIKLLDSNGEVVQENIEGLNPATDGWRTLRKKGFEQKAYITITYPMVTELGRSITGIIRATEHELDFGGGDLTPQ